MKIQNIKTVFLLPLLLFIQTNIVAQNYQTIHPEKVSLFSTDAIHMSSYAYFNNDCPYSQCAIGLKVDSIEQTPEASIYYFQKSLRGHEKIRCVDDSWLGPKNVVKNNGDEYFFNGQGDSLLIKTQEDIGVEWTLFDDGAELQFKATVNDIFESTTWAMADSIKEISITRVDSLGNTIPHNFNGLSFKISQNWGFTQVFDLFHFPTDTTAKTLEGVNNPPLGLQNITADKIFDYPVGSEFHYHNQHDSDWDFSSTDTYIRKIVLDKIVSNNQDTIYYTNDVTRYQEYFGGANDPNTYTSHSRDTGQQRIIISELTDFDKLPFEAFHFVPGNENGYSGLRYDLDNSEWMKTIHRQYKTDSDSCLHQLIADPYITQYYKECLGEVHLWGSGNTSFYNNLVFYKKGNITWGTALDIDQLIPVKKVDNIANNRFLLYPNPATDFLYLKNIRGNDDAFIQIYNTQGKILLSNYINADDSVEISQLQAGVYFSKITTDKGIYTISFIKVTSK